MRRQWGARGLEGRLAGLVLLLPRPGVDEALVQRHGVLGGDALGVLALGQAAQASFEDIPGTVGKVATEL